MHFGKGTVIIRTGITASHNTHCASIWKEISTGTQVMIPGINNRVQHPFEQEKISHPLGYYRVDFLDSYIDIFETTLLQSNYIIEIVLSEKISKRCIIISISRLLQMKSVFPLFLESSRLEERNSVKKWVVHTLLCPWRDISRLIDRH